jgi:DnaK suppressor protein
MKKASKKNVKAKPVKPAKEKVVKKPVKAVKKKVVVAKKSPVKKTAKVKAKVAPKVTKVAVKIGVKKMKKGSAKKSKLRYSQTELHHFKEILINERKAILESARANMKSLVDDESGDYVGENLTYSTHMAEQGTDEMEREKNYMFVQRDEKYLGYIQEALIRIDKGTYGVCTDCIDIPKYLCNTCPLIPKERLELVPITQHCIECKKIRG